MRTALSISFFVTTLVLAGCGEPEPRFGEITIARGATTAQISGQTFGQSPALELGPGCPGFLDPETPSHRLKLRHSLPIRLVARSDRGPLSLVVVRGGLALPACRGG